MRIYKCIFLLVLLFPGSSAFAAQKGFHSIPTREGV